MGGGAVEMGEGGYLMRDSLQLRSLVTIKGSHVKTLVRKATSYTSALKIDGDYGEEQISLVDAYGFEVGDRVYILDKGSGGFHTTVARLTGRNGNTFSINLPLNSDYMVDGNAKAATVFPVV